jgi:hypothetical protein
MTALFFLDQQNTRGHRPRLQKKRSLRRGTFSKFEPRGAVNTIRLIPGATLIWLVLVQPRPLELIAPADAGISVVVYDAARQPELARFFDTPEKARLVNYSIVLKNESSKDIVGVAVRWVMTSRTGQSRTTMQSFDSFGTSVAARQPVIPAGTELIATPNGFQHVRVISRGGLISGFSAAGGVSTFGFGRGQLVRIDDLDLAQHVTAMVDTVIFEDGRVIGPDESHLVDYINAMDAALKTLVRNVRDAISNGRDLDELLRNIASARRSTDPRSDPAGFWMNREAEFLLRFPVEQRAGRIDQLEHLPPPPLFHR